MDPARELALRAWLGLLGRLPLAVSYALADAAVPLIVAWARLHERRVAPRGRGLGRNLRIAFRERWSPALDRRLVWGWARHMARLCIDVARIPRLDAASARRWVEPADFEALQALRAEGRGLICVTGHIGVWELCSQLPAALGVPIQVVARRSAHPALDAALRRLRRRPGLDVLEQHGALRPLIRGLRRGGVVGLLADEDAPRRPVFAPFLGTLAATRPTAAFLQRASGAPIAVVSCARTGRGRFRLRCWAVLRPAPSGDAAADRQALTAAVNAALSRAILAQPEQWLWGSRRFLTRPPGERPLADGLPPAASSDGAAALG
jgi:KDO2-lipid IV(A) lauroyltransferase